MQLVPSSGNAVHSCVSINIDGKVIDFIFSTTHLGPAFGPHATDTGIERALNDMNRRTNTIVAKFSSPFVRYKIFKYYCAVLYNDMGLVFVSYCKG